MPACAFCQKPVEIDGKVFRTDVCPHCARDLHCCLQCAFYEPGRQNDCREERAEPVHDKDRSNFCDYFVFGAATPAGVSPADEAKKKLQNLFKR